MRFGFLCGVCASLFVGATAAHANIIVNPSFEQPVVADSPGFQFYFAGSPAIPGWTIVGNSVDVLKDTRWQPHEGHQSVDLTGVTAGGLYQDLPTTPGTTYHLSFWLAGNPEFAGAGGGPFVKAMRLSWGGSPVGNLSFDVTGKTNFNLGWTNYQYDLAATGPTTRLQFESLTAGFSGPMIDDLSLVALVPPGPGNNVPLPPALFAGAFGAVFVGIIRRRGKLRC
jgi:choice-of-anchor C domain-containing protein